MEINMRSFYSLGFLFPLMIGAAISTFSPAQTSSDVGQLQRMIQEQEAAWNRGDASGWCAIFSDDADFINIRGDLYHGRPAITQLHARIFSAQFKGSQATFTVRQLTELSPSVVIIETENIVTNFRLLPPGIVPTSEGVLRTRMKYIALKHEGEWLIVAAQNIAVLPAPPTAH
jgi:uncharacterized protein (TIGR02246 family)